MSTQVISANPTTPTTNKGITMKNMIRNTALLVFLLISAPVLALESSIRGIMFMDALNETNMVVAENLGEGKYRIIHLELADGNLVVKSVQTVITHNEVKGKRRRAKSAYTEVVVEYLAKNHAVFDVASKLDKDPLEE